MMELLIWLIHRVYPPTYDQPDSQPEIETAVDQPDEGKGSGPNDLTSTNYFKQSLLLPLISHYIV